MQTASPTSTAGWKAPSAAGLPGGGCRIEPSGTIISTASKSPSFFGMVGSTIEASCAIA